ncbi:zinc transporter 6 [Trichuris trichiura]|uniref:Zinc transporter 6 n=1 Tax=Trichuris trichiura TaxID=36087 RepID=A0A077Z9N6_TRITR|nr:zinc transporter 6 [Trichuris trichiura]
MKLFALALSLFAFSSLLWTVGHSKSLVVHVYALVTLFHVLSLLMTLGLLLLSRTEAKEDFSYRYERADVLGVFSVTMLVQLGALFVVKEGLEQILESYEVNVDSRMVVVPTLAYLVQLFVIYCTPSRSMSHVINASSSNWIQEQMADLSRSLCSVMPGLSTLLLPRFHPIALLASCGWLICISDYFLLSNDHFKQSDALLCLLLASMLIGTMYPLALYTGRILLQACPSHVLPELEKCLREVSTMDGVLEVADDHFWQLSFEKMAGTVVVRVRRDADEQLILARTVDKLLPYVAELTVQIDKATTTTTTTATNWESHLG